MKTLLITILGFLVISCQTSRTGLTKEEFDTMINSIEKSNLDNKNLANGWYETARTENDFKRVEKRHQRIISSTLDL